MPSHFKSLNLSDVKKLPLWRGIPAFFFLLLVGILFGEIMGRTPLQSYLPPPSVGADSFEFDIKIAHLEKQIQERGQLDCLIVGSSMANTGIDPVLLEEAYAAKTDTSLDCFNFGIPSLTIDASGPLSEALVNRFHPRLLIFILSARDFSPKFGAPYRHVSKSPWTQDNLGEASIRGWATNSSYSYRYFLFLQYWLTPANRTEFSTLYQEISRTGYTPLHGYRVQENTYAGQYHYGFNDPDALAGLDHLINIKRENKNNILIIDAPTKHDFYPIYLGGVEGYQSQYVEPMQDIFTPIGIPFWATKELSFSIPDNAWYDSLHLNNNGAPYFSIWIGEELAANYPPEFFR